MNHSFVPAHILIAGNMGYVGPAVIRCLRKAFPTTRLTGLDTGLFAHCLTGSNYFPDRLLNAQLFMDIRDISEQLLEDVDAVVNLAAISNDPMGKTFAEQTLQINCEAAVRLAELAERKSVRRYVFASSCSVYGFAEGNARKESDPLNPLTAYAHSKIGTEQQIEPMAGKDFRVTCLRFPTACGMSDRLRLDLVLNDFVASAVATGKIEILSDGTPWRPLIDTNDMALAIQWALTRDGQGGDFLAINAGADESNYQIRDLAEMVRSEIPGVDISVNQDAAPDNRSYRVDFSLYRELAADYLPRMGLQDSVKALHSGLSAMQFKEKNFRESSLIRLRVLVDHIDTGRLKDNIRWAGAV